MPKRGRKDPKSSKAKKIRTLSRSDSDPGDLESDSSDDEDKDSQNTSETKDVPSSSFISTGAAGSSRLSGSSSAGSVSRGGQVFNKQFNYHIQLTLDKENQKELRTGHDSTDGDKDTSRSATSLNTGSQCQDDICPSTSKSSSGVDDPDDQLFIAIKAEFIDKVNPKQILAYLPLTLADDERVGEVQDRSGRREAAHFLLKMMALRYAKWAEFLPETLRHDDVGMAYLADNIEEAKQKVKYAKLPKLKRQISNNGSSPRSKRQYVAAVEKDSAPLTISTNAHFPEWQSTQQIQNQDLKELVEYSNVALNNWEEELFYETHSTKSALNLLLRRGSVFLVGRSGDGKTASGYHMLKEVKKRHLFQPIVISIPKDIKKLPLDRQSVVFVDNIFGVSNFSSVQMEMWKSHFRKIEDYVKRGCIYFIATSSVRVRDQCRQQLEDISLLEHTVDTTTREFSLRDYEKDDMLTEYLQKYEVEMSDSDKHKAVYSKIDIPVGFPQCCKLYVTNEKAQNYGPQFFQKPFFFLKRQINGFKQNDKVAYLVLTWVIFKKGRLSLRKFRRRSGSLESLKKDMCISTEVTKHDLKAAADSLCMMGYLIFDDNEERYEFSHFTIYSAVCLTLNKVPKILKHCPLSFLLEHTGLEKNVSDVIQIPQGEYLNFIQRVIKEIGVGEFRVLQHSAFCDKHFVQKIFGNAEFTKAVQNSLCSEDNMKKLDESRIIFYMTTSKKYSLFLEKLVSHEHLLHQRSRIHHDILEGACSTGDVSVVKKMLAKDVKPCSLCLEEAAQSHADKSEIIEKLMQSKIEDDIPIKKLVKILVSKGKSQTISSIAKRVDWSKFTANEEQQLLLNACISRKFSLFKKLLKFVKIPENKTNLLKMAVLGDCEEIFSHLLKEGASVNSADLQGRTPLHHACLKNLAQMTTLLIDKGASVSLPDKNGATPFHLACQNGSPEFIRKLLTLGLQIINTNLSPFHFAAKNRQGSKLFEMLVKGGAKLDIFNCDGLAPIHEAIQYSNLNFVKTIMDDKDLVSSQVMLPAKDGRFPLHFAGALPHGEKLLELLIANGAKILGTDVHGRTALHLAAAACLPKNVEVLLNHKADVNAKDQWQQTPLHCALASASNDTDAQSDTIDNLLPHAVLSIDGNGNTVFHIAMKNKVAYEILERLFTKDNCCLLSLNSSNETPLHLALVPNACNKSVKLLLSKFPTILEKGKCHIHMALEKAAPYSVIKQLLDEGASFDRVHWESISLKEALKDFEPADIMNLFLHCEVSFQNRTDKNGTVPLIFICALKCDHDQWREIMDILATEENIGTRDKEGSSVMHLVAESADYAERLTYLIKKGGNVNWIDQSGNTPLHVAAKKVNKLGIKILLENSDSALQLNLKSESALHMIAEESDLADCIQDMALKGADLNAQDFQGNTPLHLAIASNNMAGVQLLLDFGAKVDIANHTLQYPLHLVAETRNTEFLELLCRQGSDVNVGDNQEQTLLHLSVQQNCIELVDKLLEKGCDINRRDGRGFTPMHCAAMSEEHCALLRCLIGRGGSVSACSLQYKTPLHLAAEHCCPYQPSELVQEKDGFESEVVSLLIENSADVNKKDAKGFTPVHYAVPYHGVLKQLVDAGGSLNQRTRYGQTCLHLAMRSSQNNTSVQYLLGKGLSPVDKDSRAYTPLHMAVRYGCNDLNFLKELVQSNKESFTDDNGQAVSILHQAAAYATENVIAMLIQELPELQMFKDMDGKLPIHYAVVRGDVSIMMLFSQAVKCSRVMPPINNTKSLQRLLTTHERNGRTLLHEAAQVGNVQTVNFLLQEGYEVNMKDNDHNMPLHSAAESGSVDKVERLLRAGAFTNVYNSAGLTPLLIASRIGAAKAVNILLRYGGSVSSCSELDRRSPLHLICGKRYDRFVATKLKLILDGYDEDLKSSCELLLDIENGESCAQVLIKNCANLDSKDVMGKTPLHLAAEQDNEILVKVLLNRGATMSAVDNCGKTALHLAIERCSYNAAWCMVDRGADLLAEDKCNRTPAECLLKVPKYWQQNDSRIAKMLQHLFQRG